MRIDPEVQPVRADFVQIERVLANLMENARRYSDGEPVIIRARPVGDRVIIRVIDRGPGIAAEDQERIFEPFYRAEASGRRTSGFGLGLAIAKGFVEANGGRIWVESTPGQRQHLRDRTADWHGGAGMSAPGGLGGGSSPSTTSCRSCARSRRRCAGRLRGRDRRDHGGGPRRRGARRRSTPRSSICCCPTGTGSSCAARLREWSSMPIIVLSAVGEEDEKVRALEPGPTTT